MGRVGGRRGRTREQRGSGARARKRERDTTTTTTTTKMPPKHRRERPRPAVLPMLGALPLLLLLLLLGHFGVSPALGQVARGRLNNWQIREASGLAASRRHSGVLYTHNDSGDRSRVFAINEWGSYLGTFELSGAEARDWEDIAIGPGPVEGRDYLYVGDIGDNRAYYPTKVVYRVMEPNATTDPANQRSEILTGVEKFEFRFPGHAGNANSETLMVDPHTGDLFIVRKTAHHPLQVFWARAPLLGGTVMDLEEYHVTCVDYDRECRDEHHKSPSKGELVGGDISPSGLGLLIKSYRAVYYWRRSSTHESFFQSDPRVVPYAAERQGRPSAGIAWRRAASPSPRARTRCSTTHTSPTQSEWTRSTSGRRAFDGTTPSRPPAPRPATAEARPRGRKVLRAEPAHPVLHAGQQGQRERDQEQHRDCPR